MPGARRCLSRVTVCRGACSQSRYDLFAYLFLSVYVLSFSICDLRVRFFILAGLQNFFLIFCIFCTHISSKIIVPTVIPTFSYIRIPGYDRNFLTFARTCLNKFLGTVIVFMYFQVLANMSTGYFLSFCL